MCIDDVQSVFRYAGSVYLTTQAPYGVMFRTKSSKIYSSVRALSVRIIAEPEVL
jgi:hypothetical protein